MTMKDLDSNEKRKAFVEMIEERVDYVIENDTDGLAAKMALNSDDIKELRLGIGSDIMKEYFRPGDEGELAWGVMLGVYWQHIYHGYIS